MSTTSSCLNGSVATGGYVHGDPRSQEHVWVFSFPRKRFGIELVRGPVDPPPRDCLAAERSQATDSAKEAFRVRRVQSR